MRWTGRWERGVRSASVVLVLASAAAASGSSGDLRAAVRAAIEERGHDAVWQAGTPLAGIDAAWQAPNREQGMRTFFARRGIEVLPRTAEDGSWRLGLALEAWGRGQDVRPVPEGEIQVAGSRVERMRPGLVEWYVNGPSGLEHGFTIEAAPVAGAGGGSTAELVLVLAIRGGLRAEVDAGGRDAELVEADGSRALGYTGLAAWDATGRELAARLVADGERLAIRIDDRGAVYPITIDPLIATEQDKLIASDDDPGDEFGYSVAIDGATAIAGAPLNDDAGDNSGSAYVFTRSGAVWTQQAKLLPSDGALGDRFGWSVALQGDTAVVGAHLKDEPGAMDSGAAYVFERSGAVWGAGVRVLRSTSGLNDNFGISVAVDAGTVIVGAYLDDVVVDDFSVPVGSVGVYTKIAGFWFEQATLIASDGELNERFGRSVSLSGNRAVIGAYQDDDGGSTSGSAYVFDRSGTTWTETQKLLAGDPDQGDWFGYAVSVSGEYFLAGAPFDDQFGSNAGAAYVFFLSGGTWSQQAKLRSNDLADFDEFGFSVSLSSFVAAIGARHDVVGAQATGSAYVFSRVATTWSQQAKLLPADAALDDEFGYSIDTDGASVLVGSRFDDDGGIASGSAYVFALTLVPFTSYCFGDGAGVPCPCGNSGVTGHGCNNSASTGGVILTASNYVPDGAGGGTVTLNGAGFPPAAAPTVLAIRSLVQENFGLGSLFGDGLVCVGFPLARLANATAIGGNVAIPLSHGAGTGSFHYQLWYRNQVPFCDPAQFNLSNGITIDWP